MKRIIYAAALLLTVQFSNAQVSHVCGTDEQHKAYLKEHPEEAAKGREYNEAFRRYVNSIDIQALKAPAAGMQKAVTPPKYIIPVVFHLIHNYNASSGSPDNISDARILDEIRIMNLNYRASSPFRNNIRDIFKDIEADVQVEFRMAKLDPNGNPTNGIERFYIGSMAVKANDFQKKNSWDPRRYLNIWVTGSIRTGGPFAVGGYAYKPFAFPSAKYDGPIVLGSTVGNSASPNPFDWNTVGHEVGHYLGLDHPFNGSDIDSCSLDGDGVLDTPPTYFTPGVGKFEGVSTRNFCNDPGLDSNTCAQDNPDLPDQYENFMDYFSGACSNNMFTLEQAARMHFSLDNYRRELWTEENLIATGIKDTLFDSKPVPKASFNMTNNQSLTQVRVCVGNPVVLREDAYNAAVTKFVWDFGSGAVLTSNSQPITTFEGALPPAISYSTPGYKTLKLTVTGVNGSNTLTKTNYIYVEGPADSKKGAVQYADWDYQNNYLANGWYFENEQPDAEWSRVTNAKYEGIASVKLSSKTTTKGFNNSLISPSFDLSGASNPFFRFYYSFATNITGTGANATSTDQVLVYISEDCGKTWGTAKFAIGGSVANTASTVSNPTQASADFVPTGQTMWKMVEIKGSTVPAKSNVRFKITFAANGGNNFYLDNVMLGMNSGINDLKKSDMRFGAFPNPFDNTTTVTYNLPVKASVKVTMFDMVGKEVATVFEGVQQEGGQQVTIDKAALNLTSGIYFVKLSVEGVDFSHKLLVN